jgi:hypothetical protein
MFSSFNFSLDTLLDLGKRLLDEDVYRIETAQTMEQLNLAYQVAMDLATSEHIVDVMVTNRINRAYANRKAQLITRAAVTTYNAAVTARNKVVFVQQQAQPKVTSTTISRPEMSRTAEELEVKIMSDLARGSISSIWKSSTVNRIERYYKWDQINFAEFTYLLSIVNSVD